MDKPKHIPKGSVTLVTSKKASDTTALITNGVDASPDDSFYGSYTVQGVNTGVVILEPTFKPGVLQALTTTNNILAQCIEIMEVNIDGTGHSIELIEGATENLKEKVLLESFFDEPYPNRSMISIRRDLRSDLEGTGNGYLEVIENMKGEVVMMNHLSSVDMRLVRYDDPVWVSRTLTRNGADLEVKVRVRERRFVQMINGVKVYFKEFLASRDLNRDTGKWAEKGEVIPIEKRASSILHFVLTKEAKTPYGAPRWLNQLPSILGSRKAEEFNLDFFDSGGLPPVLVVVQGGYLGDGVKEALQAHLSGNSGANQHRAAIVEAISSSGSLDSSGSVKVTVERFGAERMQDAMFQQYDKNAEDHVRASFRLPPLFTGRAQDYNFACYSDDTETLTDQGWITWDQYESGMRIATVNPQTMLLEYHHPFGDQAKVYDVDGIQMHHISKRNVDVLVTPKHRMMFSTDDGPLRVSPIEDMLSLRRVNLHNHVAGFNQGTELDSFVIPVAVTGTYNESSLGGQEIPASVFLEFLGYWISEGTSSAAYSQRGVVTVGQKKSPHLQRIKSCFSALGAAGLKTYETAQESGMVYLSVKNFGLKDWLNSACGVKAFEKRLPAMFRKLPCNQLQILFDALMLGDGTIDSRGARKSGAYSTTSVSLADDFQELATMLGIRASVRKDRAGSYGVRPTYRVMLTWDAPDNQVDTLRDVKSVPYTGKVYCFSVPNGVFVTRRNGLVAIQGNTALTGYMTAEAQVFAPERLEFDERMWWIVKALGVKSYVFKSKPMTLTNTENQLKAIELVLSQKIVDVEGVIAALNSLTGLNLKYQKPEPPETPPTLPNIDPITNLPYKNPVQPMHPNDPKMLSVTGGKPIPFEPISQTPKVPKPPEGPVQANARKEDKSSLVKLADQWANVLGLSGPCLMTSDEVIVVKGEVASLEADDYKMFTEIMASKNLVGVQADFEGLSALCGCASNMKD